MRRASIGVLAVVACAIAACESSTTSTPSDAGGGSDGAANADATSPSGADGGSDAPLDAADATSEASSGDAGQCTVGKFCTNPSTPMVPTEISEELEPSCAASESGATLAERCTAFCKAQNSGFANMTTCVVAQSGTTFHCRCVNP